MSRFPKLTETFILYELLALEELGVQVELYPLLREQEAVVHPEADQLVGRAHYEPFLSRAILGSQLHYLRRKPRAYLGALWTLASSTFGSLNYFGGGLAVFPKVVHAARMMESSGVEHVHCHFANHPAAAGFVVHRLTGIPFTFTVHGSDLHRDSHMLREKVDAAELVFSVSDYNRALILDLCGPEAADKVVVLRCGVDTNVFRPRARQETGGPFRIVCVGSFVEVKGHRYLIEACRLLADAGVDFECLLIGRGPLQSELEALIAELELAGKVRIEGAKPRLEVAEIVATADAAVLPSVWSSRNDREGIPVALMEAMASGVPVVASDMSGMPELIESGRNGLLVPPTDAQALADAIRRLHDDPDLGRALARAGLETVRLDYDLHSNAERLLRYFASEEAA